MNREAVLNLLNIALLSVSLLQQISHKSREEVLAMIADEEEATDRMLEKLK